MQDCRNSSCLRIGLLRWARRFIHMKSIWNHVYIRMWNMISSPATPTMCLEQKSKKSQHDITDAVTIAKIIVFEIIKCQGHPVSLWRWPWPAISKSVIHCDRLLACITKKDDYNICIYWRDIALATCYWSQPLLNMNIEGNFEATPWHHRWCHHHGKFFFA